MARAKTTRTTKRLLLWGGLVFLAVVLFVPVGSRGACMDGPTTSRREIHPVSLFQMLTGF
jgi:hypothetical protein